MNKPFPVRPVKSRQPVPVDVHIEKHIKAVTVKEMAAKSHDKFMSFVQFTSPHPEDPGDAERSKYQAALHLDAIAEALEEVEAGRITQLILTMPPRHGKSELTTRRFPAWFLGRNPEKNVVVSTYSDEFAADFGADVRGIMRSPRYRLVFPGVSLAHGGTAKDRIQTVQGGLAVFVGRGGALTGRGAHLLIADDLIKDDREASSPAVRDQAWNWFTRVALTRRMGKKLVILIMTRWHSDDPIGRLTDPENPFYNAQEAARWKIINLPAIAEDDDPLGRKPGDPLWPNGPDKFDLEFLQSQQRIDPMGFAALYQQRPSAIDGILYRREHVRFYTPDTLPPDLRIYCVSDHAVATTQRRDYTVLLAFGLDRQSNIYLLDCIWQRLPTDRAVEMMLDMASVREPLMWGIGKGQYSKAIAPFLRKRMEERQVYFSIREIPEIADKEQRAQSFVARMSMGYVHFPKDAIWTERAVNELLAFPNGNHDDFADCCSLIGLMLRSLIPSQTKADPQKGVPRTGTFGWLKYVQKQQERDTRRARGL